MYNWNVDPALFDHREYPSRLYHFLGSVNVSHPLKNIILPSFSKTVNIFVRHLWKKTCTDHWVVLNMLNIVIEIITLMISVKFSYNCENMK